MQRHQTNQIIECVPNMLSNTPSTINDSASQGAIIEMVKLPQNHSSTYLQQLITPLLHQFEIKSFNSIIPIMLSPKANIAPQNIRTNSTNICSPNIEIPSISRVCIVPHYQNKCIRNSAFTFPRSLASQKRHAPDMNENIKVDINQKCDGMIGDTKRMKLEVSGITKSMQIMKERKKPASKHNAPTDVKICPRSDSKCKHSIIKHN